MTQDSPDTTPNANYNSNTNSQENSLINITERASDLGIIEEIPNVENQLALIHKLFTNYKDWGDEYSQLYPLLEKFAQKLYGLIDEILQNKKIEVDQIEYRTKSLESFLEKINREGKSYNNPLEEITDLVGIRIIAYYREDIEEICQILAEEFVIDINKSIDKSQSLEIDRFGYLSVHYIISLKDHRIRLTEWGTFANIKAEIQVRTVLQHAWATISHKLEYKSREFLPKELKRSLSCLSALLEVADKEFSNIRKVAKDIKTYYREQVDQPNWEKTDINIYSLEVYLESNKPEIIRWIKIAEEIGYLSVNPEISTFRGEKLSELTELREFYKYCRKLFKTNNPEIMPKITIKNGQVIIRTKVEVAPTNHSRIEYLSKVLNLIDIKTIKELNIILENANEWGIKALESIFYNSYKSTYTSNNTQPDLEPKISLYTQATPYTIILLFALYYKKDDLNNKNAQQPDFFSRPIKRVLEFFNNTEN